MIWQGGRMRKFLILLGATLLATGTVANARSLDGDKRAITQAEDAWRKARIDGDTAFLERFYAAEARIQNMEGKVVSRGDDIAVFASGKIKPKFIDHGPLDIAVYGDTAVVTGVDHLGGTAYGHYGEMYLRFTDVLVRRAGHWQLVIQQAGKTDSL
jgi:ketosteroid isomerase-like protein